MGDFAELAAGVLLEEVHDGLHGLGAVIERGRWPEPAIFGYLNPFVPDDEMWRTFNMGVGMVAVVASEDAARSIDALEGHAYAVGRVVPAQQPRVQIIE